MEQIFKMIESHIGQRGCFHLKGSPASIVGGKLARALPDYIELDQETDVAYIPFDSVLYVTFPKRTV